MGNQKKISDKNSQAKTVNSRITRSTAKIIEIGISAKKLKVIEHSQKLDHISPSASSRITRASTSIEKRITAEKVENSETLANRITRSSTKKSQNTVQQVQEVAPAIEPSKKRIVKRADFYKLNTLEKDLIVLAKQKYSIPWPARILKVEKDKVLVYFFGDKRTGFVSSVEIYDYIKSFHALQSIILSKKKPAGFVTGVREVELLLGISAADSVLNTN